MDVASTEIKASGVFAATFAYSSTLTMFGYDEVTVWVVITSLGTNTTVSVVCEWSDNGTGIVLDGTATQRADDSIANGSFNPFVYTAAFTGAALTTGKLFVSFPRKGGMCRIGVKGTAADGAYSIRAQRLT